jgi:hypothetical protein
MMQIGNHLKMNVIHSLRARTRDFYAGLLQCQPLASPRHDLDLYEDSCSACSLSMLRRRFPTPTG